MSAKVATLDLLLYILAATVECYARNSPSGKLAVRQTTDKRSPRLFLHTGVMVKAKRLNITLTLVTRSGQLAVRIGKGKYLIKMARNSFTEKALAALSQLGDFAIAYCLKMLGYHVTWKERNNSGTKSHDLKTPPITELD